jgi:delta14-sterol reductase
MTDNVAMPGHVPWAVIVWIGFVAALFLASLVLPGRTALGRPRPDGSERRYRLNGLAVFVAAALVAALTTAFGLWSPAILLARIGSLLIVANVFALVAGVILYVTGRPTGASRATDFVLGRHADPSWRGVDLKFFSYRPSLIALGLLNVAFAFTQWERHGVVTNAMWLYQLFTLGYVANYFHFEHGMLFTWDLIEERFGWGLVWGDYVLVPFFYSLPGWYLVDRVESLPGIVVVALVALYVTGFVFFRGANGQKHRFKVDPAAPIWGAPPKTIGGRLLVSGFWGIARKPNYTGEILMYWAWTLPCGFVSVIPYLPALWLTAFLPHRAHRDDRRCREKYGETWERYCREVPYRLIPFVY